MEYPSILSEVSIAFNTFFELFIFFDRFRMNFNALKVLFPKYWIKLFNYKKYSP